MYNGRYYMVSLLVKCHLVEATFGETFLSNFVYMSDSGLLLFLSNMTLRNSDFVNEEFSNTFTSIETSQTLNKFVHNF